MILLPQQFQMLMLHLLMGWLFGLLFNIQNCINIAFFNSNLKKFFEFLFFTCFTIFFYYFLFHLNGGFTQLYCIFLFIFGVFLYFKFYLNTFSPFISILISKVNFVLKMSKLAFYKMTDIIVNTLKIKKRGIKFEKKKSRKNKKTKKRIDNAI